MAVDAPAHIAIVGAGPIGLEAALYARFLGYKATVYEQRRVAQHVLQWGHVRMFSPFRLNRSPLGLAALTAQDAGYQPPAEDALLTGAQWAQQYLIPLSQTDLLADHLREEHSVIAIGRQQLLKGDSPGNSTRGESPFRLLIRDPQGQERIETAEVVIDASGVFAQPNWMGRGGLPALGEIELRDRIEYRLPDLLGEQQEHYADRNILLVGAGYSAATNAVGLETLAARAPQTHVLWITRTALRQDTAEGPLGEIENDRLPERANLTKAANRLAAGGSPAIEHQAGVNVESLQFDSATSEFVVRFSGAMEEERRFDRVIANVGFRPDRSIHEELQVHECYASGGPMKLAAALLGQSSADCLEQTSAGPQTLLNPEPNFYILGAKSYGRNSRFLFSLGLQQIRDLFSIIGDRENLDLYAHVGPNSPQE